MVMQNEMNVVPEEVKGWNWGAFMYSILWGIGNKSYLVFLMLIPIFNIVWMFVIGAKGNEWVWKNGNYTDVATFKAVQETWNRAGLFMFIVMLVSVLFTVLVIIFGGLTVTTLGN